MAFFVVLYIGMFKIGDADAVRARQRMDGSVIQTDAVLVDLPVLLSR